eukprot:gnl/TRDRNA2_/TRDRNA2_192215_c0_seq1.p1 gnl/TRDRNA2_/TRDRNA2_192215_c0~~gnl/TRDRNA2_/TRDRNA2_192215_c0_seq1.p1  ORF type:complete len:671 (-),score=124.49 gnl/TRDRNA2_/TRDRNA2_192215_c0_seq1:31-2001(-)
MADAAQAKIFVQPPPSGAASPPAFAPASRVYVAGYSTPPRITSTPPGPRGVRACSPGGFASARVGAAAAGSQSQESVPRKRPDGAAQPMPPSFSATPKDTIRHEASTSSLGGTAHLSSSVLLSDSVQSLGTHGLSSARTRASSGPRHPAAAAVVAAASPLPVRWKQRTLSSTRVVCTSPTTVPTGSGTSSPPVPSRLIMARSMSNPQAHSPPSTARHSGASTPSFPFGAAAAPVASSRSAVGWVRPAHPQVVATSREGSLPPGSVAASASTGRRYMSSSGFELRQNGTTSMLQLKVPADGNRSKDDDRHMLQQALESARTRVNTLEAKLWSQDLRTVSLEASMAGMLSREKADELRENLEAAQRNAQELEVKLKTTESKVASLEAGLNGSVPCDSAAALERSLDMALCRTRELEEALEGALPKEEASELQHKVAVLESKLYAAENRAQMLEAASLASTKGLAASVSNVKALEEKLAAAELRISGLEVDLASAQAREAEASAPSSGTSPQKALQVSDLLQKLSMSEDRGQDLETRLLEAVKTSEDLNKQLEAEKTWARELEEKLQSTARQLSAERSKNDEASPTKRLSLADLEVAPAAPPVSQQASSHSDELLLAAHVAGGGSTAADSPTGLCSWLPPSEWPSAAMAEDDAPRPLGL